MAPTTSVEGDFVRISWTVPYDGSAEITNYRIVIRATSLEFFEEPVNCNGQDTAIVEAHSCAVLISDLRSAPYHLSWGSSVFAKVTAANIKGDSLESPEGNGAVILTVPDAPVDLQNVALITSAT